MLISKIDLLFIIKHNQIVVISSMLVKLRACTIKTATPSSARSFVQGDGGLNRFNLCCFVSFERDAALENI